MTKDICIQKQTRATGLMLLTRLILSTLNVTQKSMNAGVLHPAVVSLSGSALQINLSNLNSLPVAFFGVACDLQQGGTGHKMELAGIMSL